MDSNAQIISDLRSKVGFHQTLEFLSDWTGVPVIIKGQIIEVHDESIVFQVEPPDSVCMNSDEHALILHDIFISGIQGRILAFNLAEGTLEMGEFTYSDRGFGGRAMVRVKPKEPIEAELIIDKTKFPCQVVDISLNGFGLLGQPTKNVKLAKGSLVQINLELLDQKIKIPGTLVGVYPKRKTTRIAMSFSQDVPEQATVTRYITRRRVEIRQEVQTAYEKAIGDTN
jgi:hypothetical protein